MIANHSKSNTRMVMALIFQITLAMQKVQITNRDSSAIQLEIRQGEISRMLMTKPILKYNKSERETSSTLAILHPRLPRRESLAKMG